MRKYATSDRVLDIGAGGTNYNDIFPNRITLDINPAKEPDIVADAEHIPFPDNTFSTVICSEVLAHLKNPQAVINEMRRVLKPDGYLILTTRFVFPLNDSPMDYWRFTKYGLELLFKDGWQITNIETDYDPFSSMAVLLQRITFQTDLIGGKLTKAVIFALMFVISQFRYLIKRQYGQLGRKTQDDFFFSSGIFMTCQKTKLP